MFADDTTILTTGSSTHDIYLKLNHVANDISAWAEQNKMTVNTSKTKSMLILSSQKSRFVEDQSLLVTMNNKEIEQVEFAKMLGVTLDSHLTWACHIDNICSIICSRLALLRRIKPFLSHDCALHSWIHTTIIYCSVAWGNCSKNLLFRIIYLQKRAARILFDADFSNPSVFLFSKLKWIPVFDLVSMHVLELVYTISKCLTLAPTLVREHFFTVLLLFLMR
jgi:hypothetical protein